MTATTGAFSRKSKAFTIVPIALVSSLWTVSMVTTSAGASGDKAEALPDGTSVPTEAIEAPASIAQPGVIAPGVPTGGADQVVSSASSGGIPSAAIAAYQRGAQIINSADKACNIPWELIAAIGRVESNHGRYGGNTLSTEGVSTPGIYGIALNGKNGTQAINDTDGGQLDKDTVYDRAVGPMQFIPSTWAVVKVDADGDGQRNPQDIDDAALATAVYLCSGKENLGGRKGQEAAVYRYNHSRDYVNLVLRLMEAYQQGEYTAVPSGSNGGGVYSPSYSSSIATRRADAKAEKAAKARQQTRTRNQQGATGGSTTGGSTTGSGSPDGGSTQGPLPTTPGGGGGPTQGPGGLPTSGPSPLKDAVEGAVKDTTGVVKGTVETVTETVSFATAQTLCLAEVGVKSLTSLNLLGLLKKQQYETCLDRYGY